MKKTGFIIGCISALLGATVIIGTSIISAVFPKIGYAMYQLAAAGSYSPDDYFINFAFPNGIAIILIAAGLIFGVYCFMTENRKPK